MGHRGGRASALGVHLLTASGVVWALLALDAVVDGRIRHALIFLFVAVVVDGIDGTLARMARVSERTPSIDGSLLDNLVDFLNYTVVPALLVDRAGLLPPSLSLVAAATVCVASLFQFAHRDAKSTERGFRGFPSYWNVTVFYLLVMDLSPWTNLTIVAVLIVLSLVPIYWVYPSRARRLRGPTVALTVAWGLALAVMIVRYPQVPGWLVWTSLIYVVYYGWVSTASGPKDG